LTHTVYAGLLTAQDQDPESGTELTEAIIPTVFTVKSRHGRHTSWCLRKRIAYKHKTSEAHIM